MDEQLTHAALISLLQVTLCYGEIRHESPSKEVYVMAIAPEDAARAQELIEGEGLAMSISPNAVSRHGLPAVEVTLKLQD